MVSERHLHISLLGRVAVVADGGAIGESTLAARQNRLLFAYLAAAHGRAVPRDELADALWGETPPETWEKAVSVVASKVRSLLGAAGVDGPALTSERGCYRLELPEGTWIDVAVATNAVDEATEALEAGDLATASGRARLAESLLRLPFLPGEDGDWIDAKRRELEGVRAEAVTVLCETSLQTGDAAGAASWAELAVELEPFRETLYRRLMETHIAAGERAEALRVYERCRRLLAEELGAYPSPETEAVYQRLLEMPDEPITAGRAGHRRRVAFACVILAGAAVAAFLANAGRSGSAQPVRPNSLVRVDPKTLRLTEVAPVADDPDLVVESGGYLWITNHILRDHGSGDPRNAGDHTLTRVDPSTGRAVVVGGGLSPCGVTPDRSGDVWVANCYPPTVPGPHDDVVRVAARTLDFTRTVSVPGGAGFFRSLAYGGGSLWVSQILGGNLTNANTVTRLNPDSGAVRTYRPTRAAGGLAWSGSSRDLWMTNFDDRSITRLRPATGATKIVAADLANPSHAVTGYGSDWIADWSGPDVLRVDTVGAPRPHRIALPGGTGVWDIAVGAGAVWATTARDSALWRIDPGTSKVTRVSIPYVPTGVAADANDVWVTVRAR